MKNQEPKKTLVKIKNRESVILIMPVYVTGTAVPFGNLTAVEVGEVIW